MGLVNLDRSPQVLRSRHLRGTRPIGLEHPMRRIILVLAMTAVLVAVALAGGGTALAAKAGGVVAKSPCEDGGVIEAKAGDLCGKVGGKAKAPPKAPPPPP